jgi:hypothetical protein
MLTLDWGKGEYGAAIQYSHSTDATSSIEQSPNIHHAWGVDQDSMVIQYYDLFEM